MKKVIVLLLVAVLLLAGAAAAFGADGGGAAGSAAAPSGPATVADKDEVVYARLSANGEAREAYVVNHFSLSGGGKLVDYGNYTSVVNLTDIQPIALENGVVTAQAVGDNYYYEGHLDGIQLPWTYNIEYILDGIRAAPETLAGKTGKLEIKMTSEKNASANDVFFDNYMQQITITLDCEKCANIQADGATAANAGKNRMLVYTVLPKGDAKIDISADVSDFEMAGIEIAAMPFSMNIDSMDFIEIDSMLGDFSLLSDAIAKLSDGAGELASGAGQLASGAGELKNGSATFRSGLSELDGNSGQLADASSQIMGALAYMSGSLGAAGSGNAQGSLAEIAKIPAALTQIADGLDLVSGGFRQLTDGYALAYVALGKAIMDIPSFQLDEAQFGGLYVKSSPEERAMLDQLAQCYKAAMIVKGTYQQLGPSLDAAADSAGALLGSMNELSTGLREMALRIGLALSADTTMAQMKQLADGMAEVSKNYVEFHNGLVAYFDGVSALADGYKELDKGISKLSGGAADLSDGAAELSAGVGTLAEETEDLPSRVRSEIDSLSNSIADADFEPVSFASGRKGSTSFVQFVFKTDNIKLPEAEKATPPAAEQQNFWKRLTALFE